MKRPWVLIGLVPVVGAAVLARCWPALPAPPVVTGLVLEASHLRPRSELPGAWRLSSHQYRLEDGEAALELRLASFWTAPGAARAAAALAVAPGLQPLGKGSARVWYDPGDGSTVRLLAVAGRLVADFRLTAPAGGLLASRDIARLQELAGQPLGGRHLEVPELVVTTHTPGCPCCEPLRADDRPAGTMWIYPSPVIRPGQRVVVKLGSEVPLTLASGLGLGLVPSKGNDPADGIAPRLLTLFDDKGEGEFIFPPELAGRWWLVLADPEFTVGGGVLWCLAEVVAEDAAWPEPVSFADLLPRARSVLLVARDYPASWCELDAGGIEAFREAATLPAGSGPAAFPDYALYVYLDDSSLRPAVFGLPAAFQELARRSLELPPLLGQAPWRLLGATLLEVRFPGETPRVIEADGLAAAVARALLAGVCNRLCEHLAQGEPSAVLVFTVEGAREEVTVYPQVVAYADRYYCHIDFAATVRELIDAP